MKPFREEDDDVWTTEEEKSCVYHPKEQQPVVRVTSTVVTKVLAMTLKHPDTEFMVYLKGDPAKRTMTDVWIPGQDVTSGSVHLTEDVREPGIIGVLHKHPGNGRPSFSCTDEEKLNVNHDVSIVIPEDGAIRDWVCTVRRRRPCGCEDRQEGRVVFLIITEDILDGSKKVKKTPMMGVTGWNDWSG